MSEPHPNCTYITSSWEIILCFSRLRERGGGRKRGEGRREGGREGEGGGEREGERGRERGRKGVREEGSEG